MFDVLVLSGAHLELRSRWVGTSLLMHVSVAALAVMVTRAALESPSAEMRDSPVMLFVPKPPEPPPPPEVKPEPAPAVVVTEPPPKGFQTVAALSDIPDVIPPVDLTQRALDPRDFTGRGVEGGLATGVVGGTGKVEGWSGEPGPGAIYEATTNDERFASAVVVFQPSVVVTRTRTSSPASETIALAVSVVPVVASPSERHVAPPLRPVCPRQFRGRAVHRAEEARPATE